MKSRPSHPDCVPGCISRTLLPGASSLYVGFDTHDMGCWVNAGDGWYHPEYRDEIRQCSEVVGPPEFWEMREGFIFFDKCALDPCQVKVEPRYATQ